MSVYRVYVEKSKEFAVEARQLTREVRNFLQIESLDSLRILNRYDVEGVSPEVFERCKTTVFSEPQTDKLYDALPEDIDTIIAVEYLPGQYDQRADSCAQCIQLISQGLRPTVRTARIYLLSGKLTQQQIESIKQYLINPIESREADLDLPDTLVQASSKPPAVKILDGFICMDKDQLSDFLSEYGLAMELDDLLFCQEYFRKEKRNPTITEIRLIDTYWSDHCRHTTFNTIIDKVEIEDENVMEAYRRYIELRSVLKRSNRPVTLMDMATIGASYLKYSGKLKNLDESQEINACSVKVTVDVNGKDEPWLLMFKNETHNHPTEIEPFGGAATCIGGAIRDPLSGRSYVYQAMRVTGAANPLADIKQTLPGKLPQKKIVTTAAAGYSSYGNQVGVATGYVNEIYHPGFLAKRMEIGAVLGAAPESNVKREQPVPGDLIILLGGKTGRDGCGGATGSSKSHTLSSLEQSGAEVQKGNAPEERKIQRLFRNEKVSALIKRCNDFGAGGISVAIGELADGLLIDLDSVPKKYKGLDGTELAISESQERMAVVIAPEDADKFLKYACEENLEASIVAHITHTKRMTMKWDGQIIVDLSREFLNSNGATKHTDVMVNKKSMEEENSHESEISLKQGLENILGDLNICSRRGLVERFDSTIGAASLLMPYGGKYQATPVQVMASKFPVLNGDTNTCSLMAYGYDPYISEKDPYKGAYLAVIESISRLIATGSPITNCYLSFQEYFEKLRKDPIRWGKPFSALLGALDAQLDMEIASIGGKDSMSGSFEELDVPPTLVSFAVSVAHQNQILSPEFKKAASRIVLLAPSYNLNGIPDSKSYKECIRVIEKLNKKGKILSAYTPTMGGIGEALFKMSLGNRIGFCLSPVFDKKELFKKRYGSFLLELSEEYDKLSDAQIKCKLFEDAESNDIDIICVATTLTRFIVQADSETIDLQYLNNKYEQKLESVFPTRYTEDIEIVGNIPSVDYKTNYKRTSIQRFGRPTALIPVFPGTNCEYDTAYALEKAGANPKTIVIRNLKQEDILESIDAIGAQIRESQIIIIPGGFSGGDEPDGSGKFITSFFRNEKLAEVINRFLYIKDGLMCGICNGFQALLKLGLLPYGEIREMDKSCPTLTFNLIGRHQSMLVNTRICSNLSPWLMDCNIGDIHTIAISHGEGRLVANQSLLNQLAEKGQIAAQYVDMDGKPTMEIPFNPNGSLYAIEALTSPDGRVLGKMGHSERFRNGNYINVPGNKYQPIFENAVRYFK